MSRKISESPVSFHTSPYPILNHLCRTVERIVLRLNSRHFPSAEVVWEVGADEGMCHAQIGEVEVILDFNGALSFSEPLDAKLAGELCAHVSTVLSQDVSVFIGSPAVASRAS